MMEITEKSFVKNCQNPKYSLCILSLDMRRGKCFSFYRSPNIHIKKQYFCLAGTKVVSRDESILWGHGQTGGQP